MSLLALIASTGAMVDPPVDPPPTGSGGYPTPMPGAVTSSPLSGDDFTGSGTLSGRTGDLGSAVWTVSAGTWNVSGGSVTMPAGLPQIGSATFDHGLTNCTITADLTPSTTASGAVVDARVLLRYADTSNHVTAIVEADLGWMLVEEVNAGVSRVLVCIKDAAAFAPGVPVSLRFDLHDNDVSVFVNGVEEVTIFTSVRSTRSGIGRRDKTSNPPPSFTRIAVHPFHGAKLNWPQVGVAPRPGVFDLALGAPGSHEATDINNPNVMWDHQAGKWLNYYTSYTNPGNNHGRQSMSLARADDLDGPWTKDPANPVYFDQNVGWGSENGGLVWHPPTSKWVHAYGNGGGLNFATSPDLYTWTKLPVTVNAHDSFLRLMADGNTIEMWCCLHPNILRYTSTNGGTSWTADPRNPILVNPKFANAHGHGEPVAWSPPGRDGQHYLVTNDHFSPYGGGRRVLATLTTDNFATYRRAVFLVPDKQGHWDSAGNFDSAPLEAEGRFWMFYAGTHTIDKGDLNMDIQLGHVSAPWDGSDLGVAPA